MRQTQRLAGLAGLIAALLLLVAPAVSAQVGYPPGPCTATVGTTDVGTVAVGQSFVLQLAPTCVFTVGSAITVTVNGVNIPGKVANASGQTLVTITVVSPTQLSIDDPILTPAVCGRNTVTASGPSSVAVGGVATQTATFTITCPVVPVTAVTVTPAVPIQSRLSLTGANSIRYAAVALALIVAGATAVSVTRRRRAQTF